MYPHKKEQPVAGQCEPEMTAKILEGGGKAFGVKHGKSTSGGPSSATHGRGGKKKGNPHGMKYSY